MPITPVNVSTGKVASATPPPTPPARPAVTPGPEPVIAPAPKLQSGLLASLYADSKFEKLVKTRIDAKIDFEWAKGVAPDVGVPTPHYSIRWTGQILIPATGASAIGFEADDGGRLRVDGQQLLEFQRPAKNLSRGTYPPGLHTIEIDYWNRLSGGRANLVWVLNGSAEQTVPPTALFHAPPQAAAP